MAAMRAGMPADEESDNGGIGVELSGVVEGEGGGYVGFAEEFRDGEGGREGWVDAVLEEVGAGGGGGCVDDGKQAGERVDGRLVQDGAREHGAL